jgi:formate hydrogenlyase subunit 3/multisubunit Na+/H+ antiporter MnhD subunit
MADVKTEKDSEKADQEGEKLYYDSMKHLTTLNTGSVLLLVTFLEKLFSSPRWRALVAVSLVSFVISILCSVSSMFQSANHIKYSGKFRRLETRIKNVAYYFSLVTFLVGIVSLVIFALRNLY